MPNINPFVGLFIAIATLLVGIVVPAFLLLRADIADMRAEMGGVRAEMGSVRAESPTFARK